MAKITLTRSDVRRLLGLKTAEDVEREIRAGRLAVHAYTPAGRPLFDAEDVRRALAQTLRRGQENQPA
jgi:hypothetical protein